jgi:restriction system protein
MLPLLKLAGDGNVHTLEEAREHLAREFGLTEEDLSEKVKSGKHGRFRTRVYFARMFLKQAGLLEDPSKGKFNITGLGREVLDENPPELTRKYLRKFPAFREFRERSKRDRGVDDDGASESEEVTPLEALEQNFSVVYESLVEEVLDTVKSCSPGFFEQLVVDLLVKMGYGGTVEDAGKSIGRAGDGGVDGVIKQDKLGLDTIFIQAKRWENTVGRPTVQAFAGSLEGLRARRGVLITTSCFSRDALEYVHQIEKKIVLIDGVTLARHMIDHNLGVSVESVYEVKKLDSDYFEES